MPTLKLSSAVACINTCLNTLTKDPEKLFLFPESQCFYRRWSHDEDRTYLTQRGRCTACSEGPGGPPAPRHTGGPSPVGCQTGAALGLRPPSVRSLCRPQKTRTWRSPGTETGSAGVCPAALRGRNPETNQSMEMEIEIFVTFKCIKYVRKHIYMTIIFINLKSLPATQVPCQSWKFLPGCSARSPDPWMDG